MGSEAFQLTGKNSLVRHFWRWMETGSLSETALAVRDSLLF
jgi:hypothetical protein